TKLNSGVFDGNWREALEIDYKDILWPATGERLTAETFEKYRKSDDYAIIFSIPELAVTSALAHPLVLVGSDGIWDAAKKQGHPRCAGTYARILGRYVREQKVLSLMDAIRKCSLGPAQRLEHVAPMFRAKGRVQVGADADLDGFPLGAGERRAGGTGRQGHVDVDAGPGCAGPDPELTRFQIH